MLKTDDALTDIPPTHQPQAVRVGTLGADDAPEALLLQGAVGLVQVSLAVAVHHAPLAVQDAETVAETQRSEVVTSANSTVPVQHSWTRGIKVCSATVNQIPLRYIKYVGLIFLLIYSEFILRKMKTIQWLFLFFSWKNLICAQWVALCHTNAS